MKANVKTKINLLWNKAVLLNVAEQVIRFKQSVILKSSYAKRRFVL